MRYLLFLIILLTISYCSGQIQKTNPDGYTYFYYPNKVVSSEGKLINNKPDEIWKSYYPDKKLKSIGKWSFNKLDSVWIFYNPEGIIETKINYFNGKKNGYEYAFISKYFNDTIIPVLVSEELFTDGKREGNSNYYYEDGSLKEIIRYEKDKAEGKGFEYDNKGKLITILEFRNGTLVDREEINRYDRDSLKTGIWKEFYKNSRIKSEEPFYKGKYHGIVKFYDENGNLISSKRYEEGRMLTDTIVFVKETHFVVEYYDSLNSEGDSIRKFSGSFLNDKPIGVHRYYDRFGRVNSSKLYSIDGILLGEGIVDEEGNKIGKWRFYFESGKLKSEGSYANNLRTGDWIYYFENGFIEQSGKFWKDKYDGYWKWFYINNQLLREEEFSKGLENGSYIEYDTEGNILIQGEFLDGLQEGKWIEKMGNHIEEGFYKEGLREGEWVDKYSDGIIYFKGKYIQGVPDGQHIYYHKNGKLKEERFYIMGKKNYNWYFFDYYGSLIKTYTFENDNLVEIDNIAINK